MSSVAVGLRSLRMEINDVDGESWAWGRKGGRRYRIEEMQCSLATIISMVDGREVEEGIRGGDGG